jgi:hypothetical protein
MELQKINVKFFAADPHNPPLTDFIDLFHGWIQATDGIYHDVADYSHMRAGPGIVLVAHEANVSIDETDNRRGLLYNQKTRLLGSNQERLRHVCRAALENCLRLEEEPTLRGQLRFLGGEAVISINDRLVASNTEESFQEIKPEIEFLARTLFGDANFTLERNRDPRQKLSVFIKASRPVELKQLLRNLQDN